MELDRLIEKNKRGQNNLFNFILFLWIAFILFTTSIWIFNNSFPVSWDQAQYLEASEILRQTLVDDGVIPFLLKTTTILPTKAPLIAILPIPLYLLFGSSVHTALILNLILLILFFIFFFNLVDLLFNKKIALFSVITISTIPLFYGLTHYYLVEFCLLTLVVLWIYLLLKTKNLTDKKHLLALGIVSGLGMLAKFHFFIFVFGPAVITLNRSWKINKNKFFNLRNILIFALPALVISLPWYLKNIMTVLWKAKRSVNPTLLGDLYYGSAFSVKNLSYSALDFINGVISPYWFFVLLILVAVVIFKKQKIKIDYLLLSWFVIPFTVFFLGPNKDYRLMLPLLPPVAIAAGVLIQRVFSNKYLLTVIFLSLLPVLIYLNTVVFDAKLFSNRIYLGPIVFIDKKIGGYVEAPRSEYWPIKSVLTFIVLHNTDDKYKTVVLASEDEVFNINSLRYYSVYNRLPLEIITASYFALNTNYEVIEKTINKGDYLMMKVGGKAGPKDLNRSNDLILRNLNYKRWLEIPNEISLPDSGRIKIWQKIS